MVGDSRWITVTAGELAVENDVIERVAELFQIRGRHRCDLLRQLFFVLDVLPKWASYFKRPACQKDLLFVLYQSGPATSNVRRARKICSSFLKFYQSGPATSNVRRARKICSSFLKHYLNTPLHFKMLLDVTLPELQTFGTLVHLIRYKAPVFFVYAIKPQCSSFLKSSHGGSVSSNT